MGKQQEVLSFILADIGKPLSHGELCEAISKTVPHVLEENINSYHFFNKNGKLISPELSHDLSALEKKQIIECNGKITITNRHKLLDIGYKLDFELQKKIREALKIGPSSFPNNLVTAISNDVPSKPDKIVYTAGYEGQSIDLFFKKIIRRGIKKVIDVRKNPISRKYGFSKKMLLTLCSTFELQYEHYSELGIPSEDRKQLHTQADYDSLFKTYEQTILSKTLTTQIALIKSILLEPSVLICYEADSKQCHRLTLAKQLAKTADLKIINI